MRKGKSKSPAKRILGVAFYIFFLMLILVGGSVYGWMSKSKMLMALASQTFRPKAPSEAFGTGNELTLLLLGTDHDYKVDGVTYKGDKILYHTVPTGKARADMIMVVKMDFVKNTISGISIPRDLGVQLPGYRNHKINAYHRVAPDGEGPQLMTQAVEYVLPGVHIDRTVVLDFEEFQQMVDLVGGVQIDVKKRMKYDDNFGNVHVDFHPGKQNLDGYNAMMYVRFRKGTGGDSDFERQARQKEFMMSLRQSVMRNPLVLPSVLDKAVAVMGNSMDEDQIASLTFFAKSVPPTHVKMGQLPVREGRGTNLRIDDRKLQPTLEEYGLIKNSRVSFR